MTMIWLAVTLLGNGCSQFLQKLVHTFGFSEQQGLALLLMYASGLLFAAAAHIAFRGRLGKLELLAGLAAGAASFGGNWMVLHALEHLPASRVFPLAGAGPIVLVALYSAIFRGERLARTQWLGIALGAVAVVILSEG